MLQGIMLIPTSRLFVLTGFQLFEGAYATWKALEVQYRYYLQGPLLSISANVFRLMRKNNFIFHH